MDFCEIAATWFASAYDIRGKTIIEVGADPRLLCARRLVELGAHRVIASDIRSGWTSEHGGEAIEVRLANAETLDSDFGPNAVDAVVGINTLEHFLNLEKVFRAIHGILRPGGYCFLHGHPLWTSSRGHHIMHKDSHFNSEVPPIPLWAHLYMGRRELEDWLGARNEDQNASIEFLDWIFTSSRVSRTARLDIINSARNSKLNFLDITESTNEVPDEPTLARLKGCRWWDPSERFDVNGMILHLTKTN